MGFSSVSGKATSRGAIPDQNSSGREQWALPHVPQGRSLLGSHGRPPLVEVRHARTREDEPPTRELGEQRDETDVRLLHYAGTKPLDAPDLPRMRPWFAARERQRRGP